ncbi:hypothetical protein Tco_1246887 [Tanacetum coccineum]
MVITSSSIVKYLSLPFHEQTDDELTEAEIKQMEADDQAIQTILLGLPEDIYAAVDSCETAQEIWLRVQQLTSLSPTDLISSSGYSPSLFTLPFNHIVPRAGSSSGSISFFLIL